MVEHTLPSWFAAGFPLIFVGFWIGVCALLGRAGGWMRLAEAYGAHEIAVQGTRFRFRSGAFGAISYNGVLTFESGPRGLGCSVFLPFRFGHPPFSVPWSDIQFSAGRKLWFVSTIEISFARRPNVKLKVYRGLAERLAAAAGLSDRLPQAL